MTIGESLKRFRREFNLEQKTIVAELNILQQNYSRYENDRTMPTAEFIVKLADAFDVSTDYLLGRIDEPRPVPADKKLIAALIDCRDKLQSSLDEIAGLKK